MTMTMPTTETLRHSRAPQGMLYRLAGVSRAHRPLEPGSCALSGIDLEIAQGEFVAIQGEPGSGKSALLQVMGAQHRPDSGSVVLDGTDLATASSYVLGRVRANEVGFVYQDFNVIPVLTVSENVELALEPLSHTTAGRAALVGRALELVGLTDVANRRPGELSDGEQQRLAIARAVVNRPAVLLADEPTGSIDAATREDVLALLERLNRGGLTVIVATRDSAVARRARRRLHLAAGEAAGGRWV